MHFSPPVSLANDRVQIALLQETDFEALYAIAGDPLLWQQHPDPDRYQKPVFRSFFDDALKTSSAYKVIDTTSGKVIGCTRFYDYDPPGSSVHIGYTFLARDCWGKGYNAALKKLMLDFAFRYVEKVVFHVGINNIRSQKAVEKAGGVKVGEIESISTGNLKKLNFVYEIRKGDHSKVNADKS